MTTYYEAGDNVRFTNESGKAIKLNGITIKKGASIQVTLNQDWNDQDGLGEGGPWGYGGYTSSLIKSLASDIDFTPDR